MAKKSRQSFLKRQRERDRQEKAALKRKRRLERRQKQADDEATGIAEDDATDEDGEDGAIASDESGANPPRPSESEEDGGEVEQSGAREAGGAVGRGGR